MFELKKGDRVLICSDGLSNLVNETEIQNIVNKNSSPADAIDQLIELANERGGNDNITVVIMENC